ncbi:MAG: MarR family transcriptional regulator [Clostridiales bacterium]|nr:MarR family transcriptional regulator [Clostridiales bacterium]
MKDEVRDLQGFIYSRIFLFSNKLQIIGDKFDLNITTKQWFLIAIIQSFNDEVPTISMIAERLGSSRQNVKKMAAILEKKGFVEIIKDKNDGRIQRVKVTEYCINYFKERKVKEEIYIDDLFQGFNEDMMKDFFNSMQLLEENILRMEHNNERSR